jgi:hypothetical protein
MVDTLIPRALDQFLYFQDTRGTPRKFLVTLGSRTLDVRQEHLYIPVAAESALARGLTDMESGRVTVVSFFDCAVQGGELRKDRYGAWSFILNLLLLDEAAVPANPVDNSNLRTCSELIVQPFGHTRFICVRPEFGFLRIVSSRGSGRCKEDLHQDGRSYSVA